MVPQVRLRWLLTALGLLGVAALCCAYLALCLLFAQGQWQLLYQPSSSIAATPAAVGIPFDSVRFGVNEAGAAELTGWWVPAAAVGTGAAQADLRPTTVLYLHDGTGSLGDTVPAIGLLHGLGCAVFAMDYRGFGASQMAHPNEARMVEDARAALTYLEETRHLAPNTVFVWGRGMGATIAAEAAHGERLVLEEVNPPALDRLREDPRTRLLPVRLLLRDRFDASKLLAESSAAKLFVTSSGSASPEVDSATRRIYAEARQPKSLISIADRTSLRDFLLLSR